MAILEQIDLVALRSEPRIWISKLALFESLDPLTPIREPITFTTGLNIVWGVENEANDEQFEPGHGVGKTTLCRFIRYCLGEPGFGQAHAVKEIQHTFPEGCVAAEVQIDGQRWAVQRPFNKARADWAMPDATIKELIEAHPTRDSFQQYLNCLSTVCLSDLRSEGVLTGGESINWMHLLAMCARDQEARYQSLWQWRSPRSDSLPRNIQKDDAHLTLRSVLNLLPDEETKLQKKLARIESDLSQTEKDIVERQREPEYWSRHYRRVLHTDFSMDEALEASLESQDMFSLPNLVAGQVKTLKDELENQRSQLDELERNIAVLSAVLLEPAEHQQTVESASAVAKSGAETIASDVESLRQLKQEIEAAKIWPCKYAHPVLIGNCQHTNERLVGLDTEIREASAKGLSKVSKRDQTAKKLADQSDRQRSLLTQQRERFDALITDRRNLEDKRRETTGKIKVLQQTAESLTRWERLRIGKEPDSELAGLEKRKVTLERNQKKAKQQLTTLLESQDKSLQGLRQVYEALARNTLSRDFNGRVQLSGEGLEFRVFRGENLSGEAFETLSILLADIAVLLMGAIGTASHPGILIHDSPREADLGGHIYRRLLLCVAEVANELIGDKMVPFQQIITTTTPPPAGLKKKAVTRLKLGGEEGQLFGKQLHATSGEIQRELPMDETDDERGDGK
ncbi:hypothetical protein [Rubinisphaera sp.]|uniref:hypothetical protein n=1 Tax=Rubinisphaera sp. TaxID=2024857 RepID=UPI000C0F8399|nr:hypothetical protein [Rubinisphaera sp.]MBV10922.1 hypothetical protein [Rubinisphaera sp.]